MNGHRYDELPILPEEATDLRVHATRDTLRYNALIRFHHELSKRTRAMRVEAWVYRIVILPALGALLWMMWEVVRELNRIGS